MGERFTDADVQLVAEAMWQKLKDTDFPNLSGPPTAACFEDATAVLTALADAGRLTPAGAEEQWQFQITDLRTGYGGPWMPKRAVVDVEAIRALAEPYVGDEQYAVKFRHRPLAPWVAADGTP